MLMNALSLNGKRVLREMSWGYKNCNEMISIAKSSRHIWFSWLMRCNFWRTYLGGSLTYDRVQDGDHTDKAMLRLKRSDHLTAKKKEESAKHLWAFVITNGFLPSVTKTGTIEFWLTNPYRMEAPREPYQPQRGDALRRYQKWADRSGA